MLTAVFIRHGHHDPKSETLTLGGAKEIIRAARSLKSEFDVHPDAIMASPTPRTRDSAKIIANVYKDEKSVPVGETPGLDEQSYGAGIVGLLQTLPRDVKTVISVAHSDTIKGALTILVDQKFKADMLDFGNGEGVIVTFDANDWSEVQYFSGESLELVRKN